jgi:NADH:ubiquinone oxidoreductase subunit B-like Fe-S oxidoreductase
MEGCDRHSSRSMWPAAWQVACCGICLVSPQADRLAGVIRPIASSVEAVVAKGQRSPPTGMAGQADVIR